MRKHVVGVAVAVSLFAATSAYATSETIGGTISINGGTVDFTGNMTQGTFTNGVASVTGTNASLITSAQNFYPWVIIGSRVSSFREELILTTAGDNLIFICQVGTASSPSSFGSFGGTVTRNAVGAATDFNASFTSGTLTGLSTPAGILLPWTITASNITYNANGTFSALEDVNSIQGAAPGGGPNPSVTAQLQCSGNYVAASPPASTQTFSSQFAITSVNHTTGAFNGTVTNAAPKAPIPPWASVALAAMLALGGVAFAKRLRENERA